jgi:hypothetical protein
VHERTFAGTPEIVDLNLLAGIVGTPENTVKTRLVYFYSRKKFAELLKAAGMERGWP